MELSILQAAARCDVAPSVLRSWIEEGLLKPSSRRWVGDRAIQLFDEAKIDRFRGVIERPPAEVEPIVRLSEPSDPVLIPTGLATLQRLGRFRPAPWAARSLGGAQLLGTVRFGEDWLKVYRSWSGVVYHEQAPWMDDDVDWMDTPEHAETYALLEMAA